MKIKITHCFNTSIGILVTIEMLHNSRLKVGTKIKNKDNEVWIVKGISFKSMPSDANGKSESEFRGYQIEPFITSNFDKNLICELIMNNTWEIME